MKPPVRLYRYRAINQHTLNEIAENLVYVSPLPTLNDPREGYYAILPSDVRVLRERLIRMAEEDVEFGFAAHLASLPPDSIELLDRFIRSAGTEHLQARSHWGVVCFTERYDNVEMWKRYADEFQGMVFEFDFSRRVVAEGSLHKVVYSDDVPSLKMSDVLDPQNAGGFNTLLSVKTTAWEYEQEWRLLHDRAGQAFRFDIPISRVIVGPRSAERDKTAVVEALCRNEFEPMFVQSAYSHEAGLLFNELRTGGWLPRLS